MSMKSLITAIQASLQGAEGLSFVDDANIFITPDEDIIPMTVTFPAIGLKDGPVEMEKLSTSAGSTLLWGVVYLIHVILFVDMSAGEAPVIGSADPVIYGVLDINDAVRTVLHEDYQSITGVNDAFCVEETEGEVIGGSDMILLKKRMTFRYEALESF